MRLRTRPYLLTYLLVDFGNRGQAGGGISGCSIQSFSLA